MANPYVWSLRLCTAGVASLILYCLILFVTYHDSADEYRTWARHRLAQASDLGTQWQALDKTTRLPSDSDLERVANRTLGFEKIIALGLPERTDKRDALSLMAAVTGIDIEWVSGVKPKDIPEKAVPFGIDVKQVKDNFLGSWRTHMNAIREIVTTGVSSALILEDDIDWDVHIKSQLHDVALGARHVFPDAAKHRMPHSPYGDTWDLLWLGHCGEPFPETLEENVGLRSHQKALLSTKYIIHDDDTVPASDKVSHLVNWAKFPPKTRIIHRGAAPICSFAYAISQSGARKLLNALSIDGLHMAFDNSLAQVCRDAAFQVGHEEVEEYGFRCLSVNPTMMFHHKAKGLLSGDSDIQAFGEAGAMRAKGETQSIKYSMRLNLKNVITGKPLEDQFVSEQEET